MKPSDLLSALLAPAGEPQLPHAAYVGLQALLDALPIALMEFRLSGESLVLLTANAAARRMPGLGGVREPGADARTVFDQLASTALIDQLCGVARLGVPLDGRHVLRDGPRLQLAWDIAARRMASDCVLVAVSDVSEAEGLRQALQSCEQALAEARRDLREQTEVFDTMETLARAGHWRRIKDPGETVLLWSPGLCEIAGYERQEWLDPEYAMSGILPEDRPLFEAASRAQDGANVEYRWRRPDGEVRWMRSRVQRVRSRDGVSVQMGVVQDVTEEHRAAEQLREQLVFIQRIASRVPGFIYQYRIHRDGSTASVQYISEAVRDFLGVAPGEVMRDHGLLEQRVLPEDVPQLRRSAMLSVRRLVPWQSEYRVRMPDGSVRWHMTSAVPHRENDGTVVSHGFTMDITERKQAEQQLARYRDALEERVRLDPLTQVANRLALGEAMQREWEQARLRGMPLALLMIDVDHFKAYNDHYGHVAGDRCLQRVAQALAGAVQRAGELAARYGGEEFAVLLPDSDELRAVAVAHRLREAVRELVLEHQASPCGALVTISVGVACVRPAGGQPLEHAQTTLFQQADEALYRAKQAGRDRVALYGADVQAAPPPDAG